MSRYSIFGYYGQGNAGDEAILAALIDGIKSHIPNSSIGVYSANPQETTLSHGVDAYHFFGLNFKSVIKGVLRRSRISYLKAVFNYLNTDIVVIGGGGLFFDSKETNKWIFGYINLIHQAKKMGKKVALIGISVGPLHHKGSETAIAEAFSLADLISVRDESSQKLLIKCGVAKDKIKVIPDLVFTLQSAAENRINEIFDAEKFTRTSSKNIALTPCCYNTKQEGWLEQYTAFAEKAVRDLDANLWFIPMQRGESHDDLSAINNIYNALSEQAKSRCFLLQGRYSAKEIQGLLSKADFVLAERLHGSIMALNTGTQFMSIAYMPKVSGVLNLANLQNRIITMKEFLSGAFQTPTLATITEHLSLQEKIENQHIKESAIKNFIALNLI